jgi:hypothetical protein
MAGRPLHDNVTATQRRARAFFDSVIADYGVVEGHLVTIPMRQCELARRRQLAPSTIGAYLSALGPLVVARAPHIVLSGCAPVTDPVHIAGAQDITPTGIDLTAGADISELIDAYRNVVDAQAHLIGLLTRTNSQTRGTARDSAEPRAVRRGTEVQSIEEEERDLPSPPPPLLSGTRNHARPRETSGVPRASISDETLDQLLEPVHRLVQQHRLKPMTHHAGVYDTLRHCSPDQLRNAIDRLHHLITHPGPNPVSSPFGLLIQWARSGQLNATPKKASDVAGETVAAAELEPEVDPAEVEAHLAVTAFEADPATHAAELADLDAYLEQVHPSLRGRPLIAPLLHAWRVDAYLELAPTTAHASTQPGSEMSPQSDAPGEMPESEHTDSNTCIDQGPEPAASEKGAPPYRPTRVLERS